MTKSLGNLEIFEDRILGKKEGVTIFQGYLDDKRVAIRRSSPEKSENSTDEALRKLNDSDNVIKWFHGMNEDNFRWDAVELCAASMDKLFLNDNHSKRYWGPVPLPEDVLLQLAEGLSYIHSKGLVLNPTPKKAFIWTGTTSDDNNILIYGRVLMKWANCCLSYQVNKDEMENPDFSGWMAPKRLKWDQDMNENKSVESIQTSDVYEEGLVFDYFLSSGKLPGSIDRQAQQETEPMINSKDVVPLCALNLLKSMLSTSPQNRMKAKDVVRNLKRLVDEGHLKGNLPGKSVKLILTLNNILGSGMNGKVYKGFLGIKPVAVKTIKRSDITEDIQSNKREEVLKFLNHPNVVKLLHVEDNEKTETQGWDTSTIPVRVFALEFCEATLDKLFLDEKKPEKYRWPNPAPKDVEVLGQIAEGLAYIHGEKLIHRDLKPENVLIWADNKQILIKLADFGFCKKVNAGGEASISKLKGTESWIPPEIYHMQDERELEDKLEKRELKTKIMSDVYSEGLVFGYYLLKGKHPYDTHRTKNMYTDYNPVQLNIEMGKLTETDELKEIFTLIREMLQKEPEKRPTSKDVAKRIIPNQNLTPLKSLRFDGFVTYVDRSRLLGRGGFSIIFLGRLNNRDVAVKRTMKPDSDHEKVFMERLGNAHPNIIKLLHNADDEHFRYLVMELCAASLGQLFLPPGHPHKYNGPRLPHHFRVVQQIASGLKYIHSKGLMHGDPKPENLLISVETAACEVTVKWCDFALCRSVNEKGTFMVDKDTPRFGTLSWMPPEIRNLLKDLEGYELNGFKSDVFSVGCIFAYLLLDGKHPFGNNGFKIDKNIIKNKPVNLKEIQTSLAYDLIQNMIDPNPEVRFTADKVFEEVESIIEQSKKVETNFLDYCETSDSNLDEIKTLIEKDIDVNCKDKDEWNALYHLCCKHTEAGLIKIIELLIKKGIDLNHIPTNEENIALFFGSNYKGENFIEILQLFIKHGCEVTEENLRKCRKYNKKCPLFHEL